MIIIKLILLTALFFTSIYGVIKVEQKILKVIFLVFGIYVITCFAKFFHLPHFDLICLILRIITYALITFCFLVLPLGEKYYAIMIVLYLVMHHYSNYFGISYLKVLVIVSFAIELYFSKHKLLKALILLDIINRLI